MSENDFSRKIRDLRAKHNLTLEQVAQHVGVGRSTVRKWETGMIENLRRDKIAKLAEALHTTPAYLMGWDDTPSLSGYWDGNRLFEERIERGYSIAHMSSLLRISEDEYRRLESGTYEPSFGLLLNMANIFGCDLDYLCHRTMKLEDVPSPPIDSNASVNTTNLIRIAARDGSYQERRLSDQQLAALVAILDQMPDVPDDL